MSNPGDRWRKSWMVGAVGVALVGALALGRCATNGSGSSSANFTAASVEADSAKFAAELPAGAEVLILRGTVTSKTAQALRARAKTLAEEAPGLNINDQLTIATDGVDLVEPEALLVALTRGLTRPAALRVNTDLGAELTGITATEEDRNLVSNIVAASLKDGAVLKNSVTVAPPADETTVDQSGMSETDGTEAPVGTSSAAVDPVRPPAPETTTPAATTPPDALPADTVPSTTVAAPETIVVVADTEPAPTTTVAPSLESNGTIALEGVQFDLGSARLTGQSATVLDRLVKTLNDNPGLNIAIAGYTDNSGNRSYNKTLSKARAVSVLQYLGKAGIDTKRLTAEGFGDAKPRADNGTSAGRKQNRRIEVTVR